ncbi:hypothetical protein CKO25_18955 [Thiocapsa imhoffii]|uniref:Protein kinase domain-containing protein n=1 Tax=Thiocapsa imhoffii TaxID=382777 RepID=A0A9X0WL18_9GAMM|nr:DUF1566 domain-containing protein [Thiocapsa imhoffii]MBK1646679.1 hypothetical protein [Thiocapsa imhoffii]
MDAASPSACPHCFGDLSATPCPHCGWRPGVDNPAPALALGTLLDGRHRIGRVLGHGGFGITYLAWDENLHLRLAIKEYLPRDCASRAPDGVSLAVYSGQAGEQFAYGLDRFLEEARALARFDQHPGIVTVKSFFRAHGTGYCVMDYVEGLTLKQYLERQPGGRIPVEQAWRLLQPVMDALRAVHKEGLLHRDLSPDNIYITGQGRVKLLDFGAARFAAGEHSRSLSIILKPGYAPEEQYRTRGKQGPWTDVYGLAATLYRAITGSAPPEALDRLDEDELVAPSRLGIAITPEQEAVLLTALAVRAAARYPTMHGMQEAWGAGGNATASTPKSEPDGPSSSSMAISSPEPVYVSTATPMRKGRLGCGTIIFVAASSLLFLLILANITAPEFTDSSSGTRSSNTPAPTPSHPPLSETSPVTSPSRPVSPDLISGRYQPLGPDGAIIEDTTTNLQWMRCSQGQHWNGDTCDGAALKLTWDDAMRQPRGLSFGGHADWRVPTKEELVTLVYCSSGQPKTWNNRGDSCGGGFSRPTIDQVAFPRAGEAWFWSSSRFAGNSNTAWSVYFGNGYIDNYGEKNAYYVRLVRGEGYIHDATLTTPPKSQLVPSNCPPELSDLERQFIANLDRFALTSDPSGVHAKGTLEQILSILESGEKCIWSGVLLTKEEIRSAGLSQISKKYIELSNSAFLRSNSDDAWKWISLGIEIDPTSDDLRDRTIDLWKPEADQGDAIAQFFLGWMYAERGNDQDDARAVGWYRKAAEQGDVDAQVNLGWMYEEGRGVAQDDRAAASWYRKAAEQGHAVAQFNLGLMYGEGRGVAQDDRQAVSWYLKAAEQGDFDAQFNLGWMYQEGRGVAQDDRQAVSWYRKAAEQGDSDAQFNLGWMYQEGRGVAQDDRAAVSWYRKAAEQGDSEAQQALDALLGR